MAVVKGKRNQSDVEYFDYAYKAHMEETDKEEFEHLVNKYDDGEANYKLPLFNYETWSFDKWAWLRGLYGNIGSNDVIYGLTTSGDSDYNFWDGSNGLRPLIYIR